MKHRRHVYYGYSKRTIILTIALFCSLFFGLGYSLLGTSLDLSGIITIKKYDQTLYGVLEKAAKRGIYAQTVSNSYDHKDSYTANPTKEIYYWYASSNQNDIATEINNKNNVIFANHCWQMFRTTDVGGVKLIYNGEVDNNQCLNTREKHVGYSGKDTVSLLDTYYYGTDYIYDSNSKTFQLSGTITTGDISVGKYTCKNTISNGTCSSLNYVEKSNGDKFDVFIINSNAHYSNYGKMQFNQSGNSLAYAGYMYNKVYPIHIMSAINVDIGSNYSVGNNPNYYGTSVIYNNGIYYLENAVQYDWNDLYSTSTGHYYCLSGELSCSNVYYIIGGNQYTKYAIILKDGYLLDHYDKQLYTGDSYVDNGDGTYTIVNPVVIKHSEWGNKYIDARQHYYCENAVSCSNLRYISSSYIDDYDYIYVTNNYKYANSFSYSNGVYTLNGDSIFNWNIMPNDSVINHRYTCFNESGTCTVLNYVFLQATSTGTYYVELYDGKNVAEAIDEMLHNDDVNQYSSRIKVALEAWYEKYMLNYDSYIDKNITFSSCRTISRLEGWDPNGNNLSQSLTFSSYRFVCPNDVDNYSTSNPKARLKYPVGLIQHIETNFMGNDICRAVGGDYFTFSPQELYFSNISFYYVPSDGYSNASANGYYTEGVRPVIALKPGTEYISGTGSMANPYIVNTN